MRKAAEALELSVLKRVAPLEHARRTHREMKHSRLRTYLAEYIPPGGVGAEVGVFWAHFSERLIQHFAPKTLYLIDPWDRFHGEFFRFKTPYTLNGDLPVAVTEARAEKLARKHPGIVEVHKAFSTEFFPAQPDESLDWVYLDAAHDYRRVMADLTCIWPKLKPDGILFGDDYVEDPEVRHHGVFIAVNEFAARAKARLIVEKHNQFLLLKPQAVLPPGLPRAEARKEGVWPVDGPP